MGTDDVETEEEFFIADRTRLMRWLPWLHVLRAFRIALGPRKLLVGAAAAVALVAGQRAIDDAPFAPEATRSSERPRVEWPWDEPRFDPGHALEQPLDTLLAGVSDGTVLLRPVQNIAYPGRVLLQLGNAWSDAAYGWSHLIWALVVWAVFGVALCRMAILDFTRSGNSGIRESLLFAIHHIRSTIGAPLVPTGLIGVFWLICFLGGVAARIPLVGEVLAGLLWFVPLLLGLAAAVIILFLAIGWPLMLCAIGVERADAFDGFSRAYDYLSSRPWYAIWLSAVALLSGAVAILLVSIAVQLGSHFATWATGSGMGDAAAVGISSGGPISLTSEIPSPEQMVPETSPTGRTLAALWLQAIVLLEWGFIYSFFWTAMTLIYVLLRKSVDGTPLDQVSRLEDEGPDALPLSGIAAAEQREERSRADAETGEPS